MIVSRPDQALGVRRRLGALGILGALVALGSLAACAPTADDSKLPPDVTDPKTLRTPAGALELYRAALQQLPGALDQTMVIGAILTDELAALPTPIGGAGSYTALDSRQNPAGAGDVAYSQLHRLRAQVREARSFLSSYATDTATARMQRGHLYAVEGYADVLLADLFCSGIPLSTVDFDGDYTLKPGSSTREVYRTAVGLFDSALTLAAGDTPLAADTVRPLAAVGKARSLLALGVYDSAAQAVAAVPTEFRYQALVLSSFMTRFTRNSPGGGANAEPPSGYAYAAGVPGVGQHEGQNGLDYLADGDPRVGGTLLGTGPYFEAPYYFPAKYAASLSGPVELTLADGIEARLVEAEAALQGQSSGADWLTILNALRQTVGLADTTDPGSKNAQVDLLFRERAFWLYLTAHREGDLRRLLRLPYGRSPDAVYPSGVYRGGGGAYGPAVVVPVPQAERELNSQYTGCAADV